jgi:hypothetical protein
MGNETQGKRFEATGPNEGFTVTGTSSFYTNARLLDFGVNAFGNRIGVFGSSKGDADRDPGDTGIGVFGIENKIGVSGVGDEIGVTGFSKDGRGGIFQTGERSAQIRLVPIQQDTSQPKLPKDGNVGDLILIRNTARIEERLVDVCSLWLCIPEDFNSQQSKQWQKIHLDPTVVTGTI